MGQKIHPNGFRLSLTRNWRSRWYAKNRYFAGMLAQDLEARQYIEENLKGALVSDVLIERPAKTAKITVFAARPGVIIGKSGSDIEKLKQVLTKIMKVPVTVNIEEVRKPEIDAQLVALSVAQQLEKRVLFRRAMKRAMQAAARFSVKGIKIMLSGCLNGVQMARTEWYKEGRIPLHTIKADIDYGFVTASTTFGIIGIKVWIYKGDNLTKFDSLTSIKIDYKKDGKNKNDKNDKNDKNRLNAKKNKDFRPRSNNNPALSKLVKKNVPGEKLQASEQQSTQELDEKALVNQNLVNEVVSSKLNLNN